MSRFISNLSSSSKKPKAPTLRLGVFWSTQVFTYGEDAHSLRLTSELVDLRSGYANRTLSQATEPSSNQRVAAPKNQKPQPYGWGFSGAATQIRTGDLILTKDVLYQLSHSSKSQEYFLVTHTIIPKYFRVVNTFMKFCLRKFCFIFRNAHKCEYLCKKDGIDRFLALIPSYSFFAV